ncbi:MAG: putative exonuclease, partial [Frankiales bacterium]|nr:putative exonuclease [Frankiales bacterium]
AELLAVAQGELDRAVLAAASACVAAGFASTEDALAASRTTDWRTEAVAGLRAAADVAAAVTSELADPALDVPLDPAAPVAQTAAVLAEADQVLAAAQEVLGERRQRRTALERLLPELRAELAALGPLELVAREARALADLCTGAGANGLKMTLTSFVLAARLEEVAAAASVRLLRMTQGRYALVHTDGAARGGVRSGLGLLARDGWSGQDRDTSTLSGGETFLASLALALGLADVVSAEAGGARIGALFIDEGFGTLDEDTLDEVMDVLDGLREGGRIVGVVSHVAELRQRIPAQVQVTKSRSGSDVVLLGC